MENTQVPSGLLLVDKPSGWTSFDVVNKTRNIIARELNLKPRRVKVGHSGTLDPLATGLLLLAVGGATKRIERLMKMDKTYEVGATLGVTSSTGDSEGDLSENTSAVAPDLVKVTAAAKAFVGDIMQKPHKYSAVKINGQRAYKIARKGKEVDIEPRQVTVYEISDLKYQWPRLSFDACVSSGTYIRSLVEDIGVALETGAYMSSLRRTKIGLYKIDKAIEVEDLDYKKVIQHLLPLD